MTPLETALSQSPGALRWTQRTLTELQNVSTCIRQRLARTAQEPSIAAADLGIIQMHFRIAEQSRVPAHLALIRLSELQARYQIIATTLSRAAEVFRSHAATGESANAAAFNPMPRDGYIYITPLFLNCSSSEQIYVLVHEAAHLYSDTVQDVHPVRRSRDYALQRYQDSLNNAYSFSQLVLHVNTASAAWPWQTALGMTG